MCWVKRVLGSSSQAMVMLLVACAVLVMLPEVSATRWTVGGNMGWNTNFNYTTWVKDRHFNNGDWLFFVYDRTLMNVLEVNKTDYENCNSHHPLHNWTTGAGRDVVPLNVTRTYYFVSSKGFCHRGMKIAILVENPSPPPLAAPRKENSPPPPVAAPTKEKPPPPRWTVGGNMGWNTNFNYTTWAKGKHFYNGDWLYFVYDRHQMNVLEVNKKDYESCNSDHPLHNWTTGAGRDVVPLNVTRDYYFISGKGFCYGGMKIYVHVENPPPPPVASPIMSGAPSLTFRGHILIMPVFLAIVAAWDAFR